MYITASKIYGLPIASLDSKSKIGEVTDLVFSPEDLALIAFEVKTGNYWTHKKLYLSSSDVIDFDNKGIVVRDDEALVDQSEIIRIKQISKQKYSIYGQKAITKSNKYLGKIFDLLIDTGSCMITKIYVSNFLDERIFDVSKIVKVTPKAVIITDDVIEQITIAKAEEAMA